MIGVNRLRAAYAELDPGIDRYFITSTHDDARGIGQTYTYFPHSSWLVQLFASSAMFILVVDAVVAGTLAGLVANAADASGTVVGMASAAAGASYVAAWALLVMRRVTSNERVYEALFPHPSERAS